MTTITQKKLGLSNLSINSSSSTSKRRIIQIPKRVSMIHLPNLTNLEEPVITINSTVFRPRNHEDDGILLAEDPLVMAKMYAVLEAVSDRIEMHRNVGEQRSDWNSLLLTSINAITLAAAAMSGISAVSVGGAPATALKLSSTVLYIAATGMLSIMNKIQPSQLAEEQRNAARLFRQLESQIHTMISVGKLTENNVREMMEKVLSLDKAYPLPLLGAMLEKFPKTVEPAVWWPAEKRQFPSKWVCGNSKYSNCWSGKLEKEMREIVKVMKAKDKEDYLKLGNRALKLNKILATAGPMLTGLAAVGSALVGSPFLGDWAVMVSVAGGALASVVNAFEHGGQVGMVFEMYRSNAGFFKMMEEWIESNLREEDLERRENGELFEMKVCLKLGRNLWQLREVAASCSSEGEDINEFASKLF